MTEEQVGLTDSLDIEVAVDKYLTEIGIEFSYQQVPSGWSNEELAKIIVGKNDRDDMPIKFKIQFRRKDKVLFETDYGQGIGHAPKNPYKWGVFVRQVAYADMDDLRKWVNTGRIGGRSKDGFRFTHDFLYREDFGIVSEERPTRRQQMRVAELRMKKGMKAAREFLSTDHGYGEGISAAGALYCLVSDAQATEQTFEDWCGEFGYDSDSRKAEATYRACDDIGKKLKSVFSPDRLDHIRTLTQNY